MLRQADTVKKARAVEKKKLEAAEQEALPINAEQSKIEDDYTAQEKRIARFERQIANLEKKQEQNKNKLKKK